LQRCIRYNFTSGRDNWMDTGKVVVDDTLVSLQKGFGWLVRHGYSVCWFDLWI